MPATVGHAKTFAQADLTGTITVFNSAGVTTTAVATDLMRPGDWNSVHNVTLAPAVSEIASLFNFGTGLTSSTSSNGISVGLPEMNFCEPFPLLNAASSLIAPASGSWYIDPFYLPMQFNSGHVNVFNSQAAGFLNGAVISTSSASVSRYLTLEHDLAIYKRDSGSNSTRLTTVWAGDIDIFATWARAVSGVSGTTTSLGTMTVTNALTLSMPVSWDASGGQAYSTFGASGTLTSASYTMASTAINSLITGAVAYLSGARMEPAPISVSLAPGEYWLGQMINSSSNSSGTAGGLGSTGTLVSTVSFLGMAEYALQGYKQAGKSVSQTTTSPVEYHGFINSTSSEAPSSLGTNDVRWSGYRNYFNLMGEALT